jgi:hypothetical protein
MARPLRFEYGGANNTFICYRGLFVDFGHIAHIPQLFYFQPFQRRHPSRQI